MRDPNDEPRTAAPCADDERETAIDALAALHGEIDAHAQELAQRHAARLQCRRGCADCCRDDLEVFEVEAALIRRHHARLLAEDRPHPPGRCAFLDTDAACRIYPHRPYVCRTQGLPLRWFGPNDDHDPESEVVEYRDICPLNLEGPDLLSLDDDDCWLLGPTEGRLRDVAARHPGHDAPTRVRLRALFGPQADRR